MRGRGTVPPPVLERPGLGTNAERDLGWRIGGRHGAIVRSERADESNDDGGAKDE